ncbi:MAG: hypothetical protein RR061_04485 [Muribaculaceae bacterium]
MAKKQNLFKLLLVAVVIFFAACSNDNNSQEPTNVPKAVNEAFKKQFPKATNVKWTMKKNYHVASFDLSLNGRAVTNANDVNEAWYTDAGICGLSELELSKEEFEKSYAAVFASWKALNYINEGYLIDDIDLLQRSDNSNDKVIKLEIEKGDLERELFFTLDGVLVKDVEDVESDEDDNLPCPQVLTDYVNLHYKGAMIVDFEQDSETNTYEVEILITLSGINIEKELSFNDKYEFIGAEIDIDDEMLVQLLKKILTPEEIAKIAEITGESDIEEWDIEITENKAGEITISVENIDGDMEPIVTLDKNLQPIK